MTKEEALKVLTKMRAWRRWGKGDQDEKDRPEMPEPKEVDEAFDVCIEILSKLSFSPDLDKATEEYIVKAGLQSEAFIAIPSFKAGAKWHKDKIMSEVVEGEYDKYPAAIYLSVPLPRKNNSDKVHIIIVKEDRDE